MAEAGLYSVGNVNEPLLVRCYYCRKEHDGWEIMDVPWDVHKESSEDCPFILLNKSCSRSVQLLLRDNLCASDVNILEKHHDQNMKVRTSQRRARKSRPESPGQKNS